MPNFPKIDWAGFALKYRMLEGGPYKDVAEPWQLEIDRGITSHLECFLSMPRAHGKTEQYCFWMMVLLIQPSNASMDGILAASDEENAKEAIKAANRVARFNPHLFACLDIQNKAILNTQTGASVRIITSDAKSSYGKGANFYWMMDLHGWKSQEFYSALSGGRYKRPNTNWWQESNALSYGSPNYEWMIKIRNDAEKDPSCFYYRPNTFLAGWEGAKQLLVKAKSTYHKQQFDRYMLNQDTSDVDSFLQPHEIEQCEVHDGPISPQELKRLNLTGPCITAIDYGWRGDFTAVATLMALPTSPGSSPRVRLLRLDALQPKDGADVKEEDAVVLAKSHQSQYNSYRIIADPAGLVGAIQRNQGLFEEYRITGGSNERMANTLRFAFVNEQIEIYKNAGLCGEWDLKKELTFAVWVETAYGCRVDHKASSFSDRICALGMALDYILNSGFLPTSWKKAKPKKGDAFSRAWEEGLNQRSWHKNFRPPQIY